MSAAPFDAAQASVLIADEVERARAFFGADVPAATALLPILHALQARWGCVPEQATGVIAEQLNLSRAEVRGVASFYHAFRATPHGRHRVRLCRAEACQAVGSEPVAQALAEQHALTEGGTRDGVTLETVYCLGNCALGPAALVNDRLVARLTPESAVALVATLRGTRDAAGMPTGAGGTGC